jgi:tetratricopeptide (TPR) repeat protein
MPRRPLLFPVRTHLFTCLGGLLAIALARPTPSASAPAEDLAAKAQRGKEAMAAGRFDEAAALYADITRALPGEAGMLLNLGMALSMSGRPREAVPPLEAALKLRPDLVPASLFLGVAQMDLGRPARAVEPLQKVVAAQPDNLEARRRLADALWSLDRFEQAAREYGELARQAPLDPRAWYGLARSHEGVARLAFERLQRSAADSQAITLLVAQQMAEEGKLANAFRLYREALEKQPLLAEAHEAVARIYEQTGHPDWAAIERDRTRGIAPLECRSASLECDFRAGRYPSVVAAARGLATPEGLYWLWRASHELAGEAFARLDALSPSPEAVLRRAEHARTQRRLLADAIVELRQAAEAWPQDDRIRKELAASLFLANNAEEARHVLESLLQHDPDSAELALLLGETWLKSLQPAKAIPLLERAVQREPTLLAAQAALGRAYLDAGEMTKAIPSLQRALATDKDGSLHYQLARAYRATGQLELAKGAIARFEELRKSTEAEAESLREEFKITPP